MAKLCCSLPTLPSRPCGRGRFARQGGADCSPDGGGARLGSSRKMRVEDASSVYIGWQGGDMESVCGTQQNQRPGTPQGHCTRASFLPRWDQQQQQQDQQHHHQDDNNERQEGAPTQRWWPRWWLRPVPRREEIEVSILPESRPLHALAMGSERVESRRWPPSQGDGSPGGVRSPGPRAPNACCFCWCCCCSCSWYVLQSLWYEIRRLRDSLTVRNHEGAGSRRRSSHESKLESIQSPEESGKLSLEEVTSWSHCFERLMHSAAGRAVFREFLRTEFSEENLLFWLACEDLKKEENKNIVEEKARTIYEDYISILSPKEVSLDSRVREVINRNMVEPSAHTFDDAQLQIYTLMHRDSYPRFLGSSVYSALLQSLSSSSSNT
uniref:Regulator of G-protein signaling 20-like isoform X1 n=1 Tax=Petromyzon marinus TaxID=7757 RepID=A0AAJ7TGQ5_PETMA|nr:regulator of G-protein signaling 20-like isoform X1 [Petromyzon marinus]